MVVANWLPVRPIRISLDCTFIDCPKKRGTISLSGAWVYSAPSRSRMSSPSRSVGAPSAGTAWNTKGFVL